jgi:mannosyltransferase OCH1-like enzyme
MAKALFRAVVIFSVTNSLTNNLVSYSFMFPTTKNKPTKAIFGKKLLLTMGKLLTDYS